MLVELKNGKLYFSQGSMHFVNGKWVKGEWPVLEAGKWLSRAVDNRYYWTPTRLYLTSASLYPTGFRVLKKGYSPSAKIPKTAKLIEWPNA